MNEEFVANTVPESAPVGSRELQQMSCPHCGGAMSHGYIAGKTVTLRWTEEEKTYTILAGSKLRKNMSWFVAPNIEGMRCEQCKVGVFRYDY